MFFQLCQFSSGPTICSSPSVVSNHHNGAAILNAVTYNNYRFSMEIFASKTGMIKKQYVINDFYIYFHTVVSG